MWYILDGDGKICHCALWKFSSKALYTTRTILSLANGYLYFADDPPTSTNPSTPPTTTVTTGEFSNTDYYIYASKYDDGWLSAYGEFINGGQTGGLQIDLPSGFVFRDTKYNISGASTDAEEGGAIDSIKILNRQPSYFIVATSHLEDELTLEMTDEKFSFACSGRWK